MEQTEERPVREWSEASRDAAKAPLRILVVAPSHDFLGGQSIHAAQLIKEFSKESSLKVGFLPITPHAPGFLRYLQRIKYVRTVITTFIYLIKLLVNVPRYDVIHVSSAADTGFLVSTTPPIFIGKLFGRKVVLNYHAGQAEEHLRHWRRTAIPTIRRADATVVSSGWLVDVFARYGLKARAIFNHVELESFHFRERRPLQPRFLSNRNFDPIYNVSCVLRAFALVQERFPDASIVVAGDGIERAKLEQLARELELRNVNFTGLVAPEAMPGLCNDADIYLNASNVDNMPLSILEAFAAGLPVVSTNAGGIPYVVKDGMTGLLVEMNDAVALAGAATRLLENDELAASIIMNAHAECAKYQWDAVREDWLTFYREVAAAGKRD